jgi:acetylornithine deacetylase/succinyl-diaminopimelate desuccinylase-like protein
VPQQEADEFLKDLRTIVADDSIVIEMIATFPPAVSTTDSELYRAIETVCRRHFPEAPVVASMSAGFTDSHFFRHRGTACYGFVPVLIPIEEAAGVHGNDERISVENITRATRLTIEILENVVY